MKFPAGAPRLAAHFHPSPMKILRLLPLLCLATLPLPAADGWVNLFNGRDLTGWEQHSGTAKYRVEDGAIVGTTVLKTGNSFLCTQRTYGDFILELEFKVARNMNSGIQFRSEFYAQETEKEINGKKRKFPADRVFGYQYEIDPSERAWTGGVYDEARRGWLADLKDKPAAQKAFRQGEWNKVRIECRGDRIQTWINDVPATDFRDAMTPRGIIALQVHGIGDGKKNQPGEEIRWRNIRLKEL